MTSDEDTERRRARLRTCYAAFERSQMASMDAGWRLLSAVADLLEQMCSDSSSRDDDLDPDMQKFVEEAFLGARTPRGHAEQAPDPS